jgi:hypothetical protein
MSPSSLCITFETTFSAKEPSASSSSVQLRYRDASAVSQQSERDSVDASSQVCFCVSWKQLLAVMLLARPRQPLVTHCMLCRGRGCTSW